MKGVYLDSRDLIRLVSRNEPIAPIDLAQVLTERQWQLVYSFANICEVVVLDDLLETRNRLQLLDRLPHTHIMAMPAIRCLEFTAARVACAGASKLESISPFVQRWHQSYTYPGQPNYQDMLVNYSLVDQVLPLAMNNPEVCRNSKGKAAFLQQAVEQDRAVTDAVRRNRQRWEGGVRGALRDCGVAVPQSELAALAGWIRADPCRCPGWRLFHEVYLEFCTNVGDLGDAGDVRDFSHVACLPYVDAMTLDRRMSAYCRAAVIRLQSVKPDIGYSSRICGNTEAWLREMGDA